MAPLRMIFACSVALCLGGASFAQTSIPLSPGSTPGFGTVELAAGFTPDPHVVPVNSGGAIPAAAAKSGCTGHVSRAPDVKLSYTPGSSPLIISVASEADTTLVIQSPTGSWHCDDDGGVNGGNPAIRWSSPPSGVYAIWIGSYRSGAYSRARLHISEVNSQ